MARMVILVALAVALIMGAWVVLQPGKQASDAPATAPEGKAIVAVVVPELTGDAALGASAFEGVCAGCHGANAGGIDGKGPPLVHKIYEPGHHGDFAFVRAAKSGVSGHHWPFGDMPPVEGITDADIAAIITYIRTLQQANGIF